MSPLTGYLFLLWLLLFCIGLAGALARRNAILVLVGIELMLNAANLNFIAFWRLKPQPRGLDRGHVHHFFHRRRCVLRQPFGLRHHPRRLPARKVPLIWMQIDSDERLT